MADPDRRRSGTLTEPPSLDPMAETILRLVAERGPGKSICPSEAARAFAAPRRRALDPPDAWRRYLNAARQQARHLARTGRIVILRKGKPVDPTAPVKGVIRLALPEGGQTGNTE